MAPPGPRHGRGGAGARRGGRLPAGPGLRRPGRRPTTPGSRCASRPSAWCPTSAGHGRSSHAVGYARALEICLTGRWVDAAEAVAIGLALRRTPRRASSRTEARGRAGRAAGRARPRPRPPPRRCCSGAGERDYDAQRAAERAAQTRILRGARCPPAGPEAAVVGATEDAGPGNKAPRPRLSLGRRATATAPTSPDRRSAREHGRRAVGRHALLPAGQHGQGAEAQAGHRPPDPRLRPPLPAATSLVPRPRGHRRRPRGGDPADLRGDHRRRCRQGEQRARHLAGPRWSRPSRS